MKRFVFAVAVMCFMAVPAAAQYMPGTQERISHWATRTYWPGDRHHWPGYGYGGRGYGLQPPVETGEAPAYTSPWRRGNVGYRAVYKPSHSASRRAADRSSRTPNRARR
ncbi:MAG TPA: hypothetical protein VF306_14800 [Pirellulales bacterium]